MTVELGAERALPLCGLYGWTNISPQKMRLPHWRRQCGKGMQQREFLRIYEASTREERAAMDAGLGRAAGTFAQSIPMAGPLRFKAGNLQRMLRRYLSVPQVDTPHRHFCGC